MLNQLIDRCDTVWNTENNGEYSTDAYNGKQAVALEMLQVFRQQEKYDRLVILWEIENKISGIKNFGGGELGNSFDKGQLRFLWELQQMIDA